MSALREDQVRRYARHILLPDIGGVGQKRLLAASVTVELGAPCAAELVALAYLAAAGVGHLMVTGAIDRPVSGQDVTDGILLGIEDIGTELFTAVSARVRALNPDVSVSGGASCSRAALPLAPEPASNGAHEPWWMSTSHPDLGDAVAMALIRGGRRAIHTLMGLLHHELA